MICAHCEAENAREAVFCGNCGAQIGRRNREEPTLLSPVPARRAKAQPRSNSRRSLFWFFAGNIAATIVFAIVGGLLLQAHYNDIVYGNPRTFQINAVVGHDDDASHPSHFIAINLHGHISVLEFMGGNPARSIVYGGPYLFEQGGDLIPVTLEFRDVNGDGKPDMLIHIQDQTIVFINDGTKFRPQNSSDHIHL